MELRRGKGGEGLNGLRERETKRGRAKGVKKKKIIEFLSFSCIVSLPFLSCLFDCFWFCLALRAAPPLLASFLQPHVLLLDVWKTIVESRWLRQRRW